MNAQKTSSLIETISSFAKEPILIKGHEFGPLFILGLSIPIIILATTLIFLVIKRKKEENNVLDSFVDEKSETPTLQEESSKATKEDKKSWLNRLRNGLTKTRSNLQNNLEKIFSEKKKIDDEILENLHEVLFKADLGAKTVDKIVSHVKEKITQNNEKATWEDVKPIIVEKIRDIFSKQKESSPLSEDHKPQVILVVGVNGVGKTTTISKLAAKFLSEDKSVLLCAADTFRAAAIEQLKVWGERLGVDVIAHKSGSDPAAVAYDGVKAAMSRKSDVLIIDTAGRLHNKKELMNELSKVHRVIGKDLPGAPHETWLVIDATTGQNAFMQVKAFEEAVSISGLIITKLDGTAKGGVVIGVTDQFQLPIKYIGVGESPEDLHEFEAEDFVNSIFE